MFFNNFLKIQKFYLNLILFKNQIKFNKNSFVYVCSWKSETCFQQSLCSFSTWKKSDQSDDLSALKSSENEERTRKKHQGKTPEVPKIYLRDENGRLLGMMTLSEAEKLALKHKKLLINVEGQTKKIPTMKFFDPRSTSQSSSTIESVQEATEDEDEETKRTQKFKTSPKLISFTAKVSEHDLQVKMNQAKKFLLKKQECLIKVTSFKSSTSSDESEHLEQIYQKFDKIFNEKSGVQINQKRLTERDLKFNILPIDQEKIKKSFEQDSNDPTTTTSKVLELESELLEKNLQKIDVKNILKELDEQQSQNNNKK